MSKILIITNNPCIKGYLREQPAVQMGRMPPLEDADIKYIDGGVEAVLAKVRDLVHIGYPLISHPLPASIQMLHSPYRSVMMGAAPGELDPAHVAAAEGCLEKHRRCMRREPIAGAACEDYMWIDAQHLIAGFKEYPPIP